MCETCRRLWFSVSAGCKFFAHLTPGLELDMLCDEPYYVATLGGTVTTLGVHKPNEAPDPLGTGSLHTHALTQSKPSHRLF